VFGYDSYKTLQAKIESGEVEVIFKFDDGYDAFCRNSEFDVHMSVGAKRITAVKIYPVIKEINVEKANEAIINKIKDNVDRYKNYVSELKEIEDRIKNGVTSKEDVKKAEKKI
jgi:hypothetical protein